ncbi:MAG: CsbD family protein [Xanthomonadaceae bacterium]|nr:CsbD family protein [Xanthomonadaceae bacterium]
MNKNQVEGRTDQVKGKLKEAAGKVTGNESLENKGKRQNLGGKAEVAYGNAKRDVKKATS